MRHKVKKTHLGGLREEHRASLLRNLATSLILYEKVKTTKPRATAVEPLIAKLINTAKTKDTVNAIRALNRFFYDKNASKKTMEILKERYKAKNSGFTRITNLKLREGDRAQLVQIELIQS